MSSPSSDDLATIAKRAGQIGAIIAVLAIIVTASVRGGQLLQELQSLNANIRSLSAEMAAATRTQLQHDGRLQVLERSDAEVRRRLDRLEGIR